MSEKGCLLSDQTQLNGVFRLGSPAIYIKFESTTQRWTTSAKAAAAALVEVSNKAPVKELIDTISNVTNVILEHLSKPLRVILQMIYWMRLREISLVANAATQCSLSCAEHA